MENNCQRRAPCLRPSGPTLLRRGGGFKGLTGREARGWRGAAVSTLLEPNLLVQSCVKNVRDLFQALSRCGFTSVNPFTHRSSAMRLPHVTGSAPRLARARPAAAPDATALSGPVARTLRFGVKRPQNVAAFSRAPAADRPPPARAPVLNHFSL